MSNHLHVVLRDDMGELAGWASYFLGNLARAVNRIRGRSGSCFARRYSAEPILDAEALHDRLIYVATNPVKAGLCERAIEWPGVVLFAADPHCKEIRVSWIDRGGLRQRSSRARRAGRNPPNGDVLRVEETLLIDPIPAMDGHGHARVEASIEAREQVLALERNKARRRCLTRAQVLAQSWHRAPKKPKSSPRPLCHAADPGIRAAFKKGFEAFISLFREASQRLRERGARAIPFPEWCFPPGSPLIRSGAK